MENTNTNTHPGNSFGVVRPVQTMMPYLPPNIRDYIIRDANWRGVGPDPVFPRS